MPNLPDLFPGFATREIETAHGRVFTRVGGHGPPLLLLHGYPQTHAEWHRIAPQLAERYTVVMPDLRGYGASFLPGGTNGDGMTKRAMGEDAVALMQALGFSRFRLVGHDRGGRVAYRLAYDHPERLEKVSVIDIIPTAAMFRDMGRTESALRKYHWLFLAQPAPYPETMIGNSSAFYLEHTIASWTAAKNLAAFDAGAMQHYHHAFDAPHIHTTCECYRAGALIDRLQDEEDLATGRKIAVPVQTIWGESGLSTSGITPLEVWRDYADDVVGQPIPSGHFVPEENPEACLVALLDFLA